jgi:hypothetical protein
MNINKQNYEEWMVAFMDNELDENELQAFNSFLAAHPELKTELNDFKSTQFKPESNIVFEGKEALYKTNGALLLLKKSWPIAAALAILLVAWPFLNNKESNEKVIVKNEKNTVEKEANIDTPIRNQEAIVSVKEEEVESTVQQKEKIVLPKKTVGLVKSKPIPRLKRATSNKNVENVLQKEKVEHVLTRVADLPKKAIEKQENKPTLKPQVTFEDTTKEVVVQENKAPKATEPALPKESTVMEEKDNALVTIDEVNHPRLYNKINTVVTQVEEKIETIKEIKRKPITICIGKRKLFTINN